MKHIISLLSTVFIVFSFTNVLAEQSALDVLRKSDQVESAAKDQSYVMKMVLVDKKGNKKEREAKLSQKGDDKRMLKFLAPGDIKGVGILTLPNDVIYFYMPAFNKVRRIASHVKNQSFMGTDLTYDDFSSIKLEDDYNAVSIKKEGKHFILELKPKKDSGKEYSKLLVYVNTENYYNEKTEYFDKKGNLWKVMERNEIKKVGEYWVAHKFSMKDIKKNHSTLMELKNIEFDKGLGDELFSQRYLKRN